MMTLLLPLMLACSGKDTPSESGDPTDTTPDTTDDTETGTPSGPGDDSGTDTDPVFDDCLEIDPAPIGEPALVLTGERPTNLLIISIDTLNISRLSRYGGPADAPTLSAYLSEGLTLDNHFACAPWTYPGILCSMSGQSNLELGFVPTVYGGVIPGPAPESNSFLPDLLKAEGYGTQLVTANPYLSSLYTVGRGFDQEITSTSGFPAGPVFDEGRAMVSRLQSAGEPWYAHVHLLDPHASYLPPTEYREDYYALLGDFPFDLAGDPTGIGSMLAAWGSLSEEDRALGVALIHALYDGEIAYLDDQLELFMADMDAAGALDDTLVVFFSDHGEQFMEHGALGHGLSLYNGELGAMASFWMKSGGVTPAAWTGPTDQRDIVPTIFDALDLPAQDAWSGQVAGTADPGRALMSLRFHGTDSEQALIRDGNKLIFSWGEAPEYYDLAADYDEEMDIFDLSVPQHSCDWEAIQAQTADFVELYPEYADSAEGR